MRRLSRAAGLLAACMLVAAGRRARAEPRRVSARHDRRWLRRHAGPGFTYANQLLFYSRDESKADDGSTLPVSGQNAVIMDMNSFIWVSRRTFLGGAHYSAVATLPVAKNQLVSDIHGQLSGGGGFADSYYLPLILGWNKERASIRALAGFLAPTGRFTEGASDNVGSGYWTPTLSSGQTVQLTRRQRGDLLCVPTLRVAYHASKARARSLATRSISTTRCSGHSRSQRVRRVCRSASRGTSSARRRRRRDRQSARSNRASGTPSMRSGS